MYTLTQAKDLVINQGYAIKNDDSVDKLNEVMSYIEEKDVGYIGLFRYYSLNDCDNIHNGDSINLSEIELPKQITIEMVIELRKQYPNNLEFGDKLDVLFGGMK
mgnify:CR=1 FL=1